MRTPIYSFDTSEVMLAGLRNRISQGDQAARPMLISLSTQYRRDLRTGRAERPFGLPLIPAAQ